MQKEASFGNNTIISRAGTDMKGFDNAVIEKNGERQHPTNLEMSGISSSNMKKSVSMLEMSEIADVHAFHDALCSDDENLENLDGFQIGGVDSFDNDDEVQEEDSKKDNVEVESTGLGFRGKTMSMVELRSNPTNLDTINEHSHPESTEGENINEVKSVKDSTGSIRPYKSAMKQASSLSSFTSTESIPESQAQISSNGGSNSESKTTLKRNVSFSSLEIREYPMTLGDNPSVSMGPPVALSWEHDNVYTIDLEKYEDYREPRRLKHELIISYYARKDMIMKSGCTNEELKRMILDVKKAKNQRQTTYTFLPVSKVEEAWESARRKFRRYRKSKMN